MYGGYQFFHHCIFTRRYVDKLHHISELMKPTDEYTIGVNTMKLLSKSFLVLLFAIYYSLQLKNTSLYQYCMIFSVSFLLAHQLIMNGIEKEEYKLLKQLEKYLSEVRHYFQGNGTVEEAIYESLDEAEYEISLHVNRIYQVLNEGDDNEITNYREIAPNKYLVTFMALCQTTIVYGDTIKEGKSLFLSNLNHLKNEINTELLKRDKAKHIFSGLLFITVLPIFFLKSIEHWGISNLPRLSQYYNGAYGIIISLLIFISTILSYRIIFYLKTNIQLRKREHPCLEKVSRISSFNRYIQKWCFYHPLKAIRLNDLVKSAGDGITLRQYLTQKVLIFVSSLLIMNVFIFHLIGVSKWNSIHYVGDYNGTSFTDDKKEILQFQNMIEEHSNCFKNHESVSRKGLLPKRNLTYRYSKLKDLIKERIAAEDNRIHSYTIDILSEEIIGRIMEYQNCRYHWYYIILTISLSYFTALLPYFLLNCKKIFQKMSMEDEVIGFHSMIIMLMYIPGMSVERILDWLENFSENFRSSIMECVDNFSYDEEGALTKLRTKESFLPFTRIVQNLEACDKVGVEKAFDELVGQRNYYIEKRKQENEIIVTNKGVIGKVIAYIPLFLTISLYLIIPFVLESIEMFMSYVTQINSI